MKRNKMINTALFLLAIYLILMRYMMISDLILGSIFGLSLALFVMGLLPEKILKKIKMWKKMVFSK